MSWWNEPWLTIETTEWIEVPDEYISGRQKRIKGEQAKQIQQKKPKQIKYMDAEYKLLE